MRARHLAFGAARLGALCIPAHAESARDTSRDTLPADDGWAAHGSGTTGGSAADDARVCTATDRAGLAGILFNGHPVDLLAIYNVYDSGSERDLTAEVSRPPTLHTKIDSAEAADREVAHGAGAGRIS
ncbi:hypothetical protein ACWCRD_21890 [Streptomyces sp. NPDC002092]